MEFTKIFTGTSVFSRTPFLIFFTGTFGFFTGKKTLVFTHSPANWTITVWTSSRRQKRKQIDFLVAILSFSKRNHWAQPNLSLMCLLMGTSNSNGKDEMWYLPRRRRTDLGSKTHFPTINVSPPTPTWVNTNTWHRLTEYIVTQFKRSRFKPLCQRKSYKRFRYDVLNWP